MSQVQHHPPETVESLSVSHLRFNRPKNYIGVALAVVAEGATGGLTMNHVTQLAGDAKLGCRELGLLSTDDTLTERGDVLVTKLISSDGTPEAALQTVERLQGTTNPLHQACPDWVTPVQRALIQYPPAREIVKVLLSTGPVSLHQLTSQLDSLHPRLLSEAFLRADPDECQGNEDSTDIYETQVTSQLKTNLYHADILTEPGQTSDRLHPRADQWELTDPETASALLQEAR